MPAHYQKFHCSLCEKTLGYNVCKTVEDLKKIYNVCYEAYENGSGVCCPDCFLKLEAADVAIDK